uniref:Lipocalin n=1 Tax=Rhipicephalus zambeziensis TaxID=60191 RepID=A0A224YCC7_9ACAR
MSHFAVALCTLFVASALAEGKPGEYAEKEENFAKQRLSDLTGQDKRFYILKRDYYTLTKYMCHSAKKVHKLDNKTYVYELKAKFGSKFKAYNVTVDAITTGNHKEPNGANYQENPNEGRKIHRIMTKDDENSCFVVTVNAEGKDSCFLLVREDKVDKGRAPKDCEDVYTDQCGEESVILYDTQKCKEPTTESASA